MGEDAPVLVFDLGGVLIESDMFSELRKLMSTEKSEPELVEMWLKNPLTRAFELGRCPIDEFSHSVVSELNLPLEPEAFLAEFRRWPKGFHSGVEAMLTELRQRYTVCCLSNSNAVHWSGTSTHLFHYAFSSHLIGCIKPDPEAFEYVLSETGARPESMFFFDDALLNVQSALNLNIHAYHTMGFDAVKAQLGNLGFLD